MRHQLLSLIGISPSLCRAFSKLITLNFRGDNWSEDFQTQVSVVQLTFCLNEIRNFLPTSNEDAVNLGRS